MLKKWILALVLITATMLSIQWARWGYEEAMERARHLAERSQSEGEVQEFSLESQVFRGARSLVHPLRFVDSSCAKFWFLQALMIGVLAIFWERVLRESKGSETSHRWMVLWAACPLILGILWIPLNIDLKIQSLEWRGLLDSMRVARVTGESMGSMVAGTLTSIVMAWTGWFLAFGDAPKMKLRRMIWALTALTLLAAAYLKEWG